MRQDISTYECAIEEKFEISKNCDKILQTVNLRKKRLERLDERTGPEKEQFLDGILDNV